MYRAWHLVIVSISLLSTTYIYGNHVCNMFHQWVYWWPLLKCFFAYIFIFLCLVAMATAIMNNDEMWTTTRCHALVITGTSRKGVLCHINEGYFLLIMLPLLLPVTTRPRRMSLVKMCECHVFSDLYIHLLHK